MNCRTRSCHATRVTTASDVSRSHRRRVRISRAIWALTALWPLQWPSPCSSRVKVAGLPMSWKSMARRNVGSGAMLAMAWRVCSQTS